MDSHQQRKADHLRISLSEDVQFSSVTTGLERFRFNHNALPELDLSSVDTSQELLGRGLRLPLLISSMTGGTAEAQAINRRLAQAAQETGVALGLGSQRAALENQQLRQTFRVREFAPDVLLLANLGAVQLNYGYTADQCQRAVDMAEADGLVLHLNPLQEALQEGGNRDWSGLLRKIETVCRILSVPVVVKEVGWGIGEDVARRLAAVGVAAIDVAGAGGTSWSEVERHRASETGSRLALAFTDWGIPTAEALVQAGTGAPGLPIIASGGIRTGIDVAKALALGASAAGMAAPLLQAAAVGAESVAQLIGHIAEELRIAMFCAGAGNLAALSEPGRLARVA